VFMKKSIETEIDESKKYIMTSLEKVTKFEEKDHHLKIKVMEA